MFVVYPRLASGFGNLLRWIALFSLPEFCPFRTVSVQVVAPTSSFVRFANAQCSLVDGYSGRSGLDIGCILVVRPGK